LPGRGFVLTSGEDEDEFKGVSSLVAYVCTPGAESICSEIDGARARLRAGVFIKATLLVVNTILVRLARHAVGAEGCQIHAEAASRVLHPVLVQSMVAVELLRLVEKVSVEAGHIIPVETVGSRLWVGENGRVLGHCDDKVMVRIIHCDQSDVEVAFGP
jgi:hypothetical protein